MKIFTIGKVLLLAHLASSVAAHPSAKEKRSNWKSNLLLTLMLARSSDGQINSHIVPHGMEILPSLNKANIQSFKNLKNVPAVAQSFFHGSSSVHAPEQPTNSDRKTVASKKDISRARQQIMAMRSGAPHSKTLSSILQHLDTEQWSLLSKKLNMDLVHDLEMRKTLIEKVEHFELACGGKGLKKRSPTAGGEACANDFDIVAAVEDAIRPRKHGEAPAELDSFMESQVLRYEELRKCPTVTHESAMSAIKATYDLYETVFGYKFDTALLDGAILTRVFDSDGKSYMYWSNVDESIMNEVNQNENLKRFFEDFDSQGAFGVVGFDFDAARSDLNLQVNDYEKFAELYPILAFREFHKKFPDHRVSIQFLNDGTSTNWYTYSPHQYMTKSENAESTVRADGIDEGEQNEVPVDSDQNAVPDDSNMNAGEFKEYIEEPQVIGGETRDQMGNIKKIWNGLFDPKSRMFGVTVYGLSYGVGHLVEGYETREIQAGHDMWNSVLNERLGISYFPSADKETAPSVSAPSHHSHSEFAAADHDVHEEIFDRLKDVAFGKTDADEAVSDLMNDIVEGGKHDMQSFLELLEDAEQGAFKYVDDTVKKLGFEHSDSAKSGHHSSEYPQFDKGHAKESFGNHGSDSHPAAADHGSASHSGQHGDYPSFDKSHARDSAGRHDGHKGSHGSSSQSHKGSHGSSSQSHHRHDVHHGDYPSFDKSHAKESVGRHDSSHHKGSHAQDHVHDHGHQSHSTHDHGHHVDAGHHGDLNEVVHATTHDVAVMHGLHPGESLVRIIMSDMIGRFLRQPLENQILIGSACVLMLPLLPKVGLIFAGKVVAFRLANEGLMRIMPGKYVSCMNMVFPYLSLLAGDPSHLAYSAAETTASMALTRMISFIYRKLVDREPPKLTAPPTPPKPEMTREERERKARTARYEKERQYMEYLGDGESKNLYDVQTRIRNRHRPETPVVLDPYRGDGESRSLADMRNRIRNRVKPGDYDPSLGSSRRDILNNGHFARPDLQPPRDILGGRREDLRSNQVFRRPDLN